MVEETNAQPVVNEPKPGNEGGAAAPKAAPEKSSEPKAPSNKELKEMKKREKAAKRAAQKAAIGITPEQQQQLAQQKMDKKKQQTATTTNIKKQLDQTVIRNSGKQKIPALFSHLETREQRNASSPAISHIVHPAILALTLKYSTYLAFTSDDGGFQNCDNRLSNSRKYYVDTTLDGTSLTPDRVSQNRSSIVDFHG